MGLFDIFKKKKSEEAVIPVEEEASVDDTSSSPDSALDVLVNEITNIEFNEADLIEITDCNVIARINALVPTLTAMASGTRTVADTVAKNSGEKLYRVVLKGGGELVDSRTMPGAKRAMVIGANGILENANLQEYKPDTLQKSNTTAKVGASVMNVASVIVGQYYMNQVDGRIAALQSGVETILDFLDIQYKSEVISLLEAVSNISKFQIFTLENEELRKRELDNVQELGRKCLSLLNQAEIHLEQISGKACAEYSDYEDGIKSADKWMKFEEILLQLLNQISTLDFTLHIGLKAKEQCFNILAAHSEKTKRIHTQLIDWHEKQCDVLGVDLSNKRRKNIGVLASILEKPIKLINDKWNYKRISDDMISLIQNQSVPVDEIQMLENNLFNENVNIIIRGEKKYFLP